MDRCDQCLFWKMARPGEGWCRRRAPGPANESDRVAHWPTTHGAQGCGEFLQLGAARELVLCGQCRYWRKPAGGLQPVDRGDKTAHWWAQAGLCVRHAPEPISEPGPRAFWRATLGTDSCAEGLLRPQMSSE
jgi:hypothetical protein